MYYRIGDSVTFSTTRAGVWVHMTGIVVAIVPDRQAPYLVRTADDVFQPPAAMLRRVS